MARRRVAQHRQAFDAFALKRVRARAWFEGAAAHQTRARGGNTVGGCIHLRLRLDRARPCDDLDRSAADRGAVHIDDRARLMPFPCDELVGLQDVHRALDTGQRIEHLRVELALVTHRADQRALGSA